MSINSITNLNQYAAMQSKQTQWKNKEANPTVTKNNATKTATSDNVAVKVDLASRKAAAKKPIDDEEIQQRIADREAMRDVDINDVRKSLESSRPHAAEVERSKQNAAKYGPIQSKMLSGKPLTAEEKSFLRENYPEAYAAAMRIEEEVKMLKSELAGCKSKADADKLVMQKKMQALGRGKDDSIASSLIAAFDEAYRNY